MITKNVEPKDYFVVTPPRHTLGWIRASVIRVNKRLVIEKSEIVDEELTLEPFRKARELETTYFTPSDHVANIAAWTATHGFEDEKRGVEIHLVNPLDLEPFTRVCPNLSVELPYFNTPIPFPNPNLRFASFLNEKKPLRIGIVNAFGGGWGDLINGLTALYHVKQFFQERRVEVVFRLFSLKAERLRLLLERDPLIKGSVEMVTQMPTPIARLLECDFFFDVSNCTGWPSFQQPFVDFYLNAFSILPVSIEPFGKRHVFVLDERDVDEETIRLVKEKKPYILLAPNATAPVRSLSEPTATEICRFLLEQTSYNIIVFGREKEGYKVAVEDPRVVQLPHGAKSFLDALFILKHASMLIGVDSALAHFADAFDVPALVVFTTIQPQHRLAYYPFEIAWLASTKPHPFTVNGLSAPPEVMNRIRHLITNVFLPALPTLFGHLQTICNRRFSCPLCGLQLERTYNRFHTGEIVYQCPKCQSEFSIDLDQDIDAHPLPTPYIPAVQANYLFPIPKVFIKIEDREKVFHIIKLPDGRVFRQPLLAKREKVEDAIFKSHPYDIKKKEGKDEGSGRRNLETHGGNHEHNST